MPSKITQKQTADNPQAINTEVPAQLWRRFKVLSVERGCMLREQLAEAIERYLREHKA